MKRSKKPDDKPIQKTKKGKFNVELPETFESAVLWLIEYAPKFYLRHIDYKLSNVMDTRAKMSTEQLRTCWKHFEPLTYVQRYTALFLIQSVYMKLKRESENLQTSVAPCNYDIGWNMAMVYTLEKIPIHIKILTHGKEYWCTIRLQCSFKPLYDYTVFFDWAEIAEKFPNLPKVHPSMTTILMYNFDGRIKSKFVLFMETWPNGMYCTHTEPNRKFDDTKHSSRDVFLLELNPVKDYVAYYSMKEIITPHLKLHLIDPLVQIVKSYLV